ncbi:putative type IX secretion system sortase PorU2 [Cyclobacterium qasimii]|uniref:Gingipain domain-containing protein n=2 Tax=Cyclobacterium qasimii TaxID=1350429 RepID=A0A512CC58_9BACT|nr:C25 family cysteine peptidase [Cyclobacterium qasimii]GEO21757.1 hypothetical protein CQA01_22910 [Cyclobacterium qasimii]
MMACRKNKTRIFRTALLVAGMFVHFFVNGQSSQWLNYDRDYYKIPTYADGVYRLSYTTLSASGVSMDGLDPREIKVFHRGEEVAVYVSGQQDGSFDQNDYLEFVGKRNDGTLDKLLYEDESWMTNPHYNTYNDTTAYFLTIAPGTVGKRMASPSAGEGLEQVSTYKLVALQQFSEDYTMGREYFPGVRLSKYDLGQGWTSSSISKGRSRTLIFDGLGQVVSGGVAPELTLSLVGRSETSHKASVAIGPTANSLREIGQFTFEEYENLVVSEALLLTDFSEAGDFFIKVTAMGVDNGLDNISINYAQIDYNSANVSGDFELKTFEFNEANKALVIKEVNEDYNAYNIADFNNPVRLEIKKSGNELYVPTGDGASEVLVQNQSNVIELNVLEKVRFRDLLNQQANFIIISHELLREPADNYGDPVGAYAAYRATPLGGGFDTLTVNVQDLYDQFSFGEKSPLGIRRFLELYQQQFVPENVLLIGRAYGMINTRRTSGVTYFYRNNPSVFTFQELVPTFGFPYSDNRFVIGLDPSKPLERKISVGRIPARTPNDVGAYLDKIKEKDALGVSEPWQKNLMHLSGGRSAFELERFYNFLNGFKVTAEDVYLGGNVETIRKRSNATTELINVSDEVNDGVSLVTFFGHAAPSTTDIDIGFASVNEMGYRNKGKYPVLLLNGCDAGNAFGDAYTFGEDWIITPDRGASNFLAHADIGIDVYLRRYSESFYNTAFADSSMIYQNLGKVKLKAEELFYSRYGSSEVNQSHANQIIMLGDPAARIFPANKADYAIYADDIELGGVNDQVLNSLSDTLELTIPIRNLGIVDLGEVDIDVRRQLPDGTVITLPINSIEPIFRLDTLILAIPNSGINSFGDNVFTITVNKSREIEEMTYANNAVSVTFFVPLSGTLNLYPHDFGIVNETNLELIAQIPGLATEQRNLIIQLDTASDFSSPKRQEVRVTTNNLARWDVNLFEGIPKVDSLTYYWRTKFSAPREGEDVSWKESSFSYIEEGPEGWTQRKLPQFLDNQLSNINISLSDQNWQFQDTALNIDIFTFGSENEGYRVENTQIMLDGVAYILDTFNRFCPNGTLGLMAFDHRTLEPYLPVPLVTVDVLDSRSCGRVPQVIQSISNINITGEGRTMLLDFVDGVNEDDYVVIFSVGRVTFSDWPDEAYFKLKELGANEATLRNLETGDPYILFGRKGMKAGEAIEVVPTVDDDVSRDAQVISFETDIQGYFPTGSILSPKVGPASDWVSFFNEVKSKDLFDPSLSAMDVVGVTPDGGEVSLLQDVDVETVDLSSFDALSYPFLRLRYSLEDLPDKRLPQLSKWQVAYTGVAEGVLILKDQRKEVILNEGEQDQLAFEFINISKHDFFDSIQVDYSFYNIDQRKITRETTKIPAVKAGESSVFTIDFDSKGKSGDNSLNVFVNPRILTEQIYTNNVMDLPKYFKVKGDDLNPVLDVNFDGKYIMNGDIVSPTVIISTKVKDENKIALKQDTLGMELMLREPCEACDFERVSFSNARVKWFEATENADFTIEFQPGPLEDGIYTLRINASDGAGNSAGTVPYEVSFEVINESQITNFYPYPNPFSSSVRFVFTLTGAEIPDEIKIQIMTITGKVVKEIFQDELGPITIGNNITTYAWDGKDEFGDQLANGVYIYRVLVRKNGQFMEHRNTSADKAFKKGYGKMYLLR